MIPARVFPVSLVGDRVGLRELTGADVDAVHGVVGDPRVCAGLIFPPKSREETGEYVGRAAGEARQDPRGSYFLGIVEVSTDDLVGTARLGLGDYRSGVIGYAVRRDRWNRGYATEATGLLIRFGVGALGLHRVWASHGPANPSSGRVLEKAGMVYEGTLRHNVVDKGRWRDSLVYARIADTPT